MAARTEVGAGDSLADGRYRLLAPVVGRGGLTFVWRAHDAESGQVVAIRVLRPDLAAEAFQRERFFRGARVTAELAPEAVVPILEPERMDGDVAAPGAP
jgi:serine/threonine protein kinase